MAEHRRGARQFQSLFFWIHFYNGIPIAQHHALLFVFQSLFFWIHFYNSRSSQTERSTPNEVSILVFLDSLLQPSTTSGRSCISGMPCTFQSLFFWIHFYNSKRRVGRTGIPIAFQSLFFWIHFYNDKRLAATECALAVSILVFLDSLLQLGRLLIAPHLSLQFQSLFFWIHFYNPSRPPTKPRSLGRFNPCFSGFTSTTAPSAPRSAPAPPVSILVFLDSLLQPVALVPSTPPLLHVSILVFLDSLLQPIIEEMHEDHTATLFQSLFFWIHFYNVVALPLDAPHVPVFQSLFFWIHFYNLTRGDDLLVCVLFQSLFFWIHFYNQNILGDFSVQWFRFNPCFSGFTSTTGSGASGGSSPPSRFNPCFSGFTSTTRAP